MKLGFQYDCIPVKTRIYLQLCEGKAVKQNTFTLIALALLTLTGLPAAADDKPMIMPMDGKAVTETYQGKGKVNSVDAKAGKINLSHEAIASLGWPGMTMDFDVQDKAMLAKLKAGQKVTFTLIEIRKGKYVISEINVVK
jgi:Cu(I)/Ag(I) efflux system periplasmic protein CusF